MPLPERRKSPEELAKLRESLGIPSEGPPPDVPGVRREDSTSEEAEELKTAVFEQPVEDVPGDDAPAEETSVPSPAAMVGSGEPERSTSGTTMPQDSAAHAPPPTLRKSASLVVDQPKPVRHREDGSLPVRRHTDDELRRLRRMDAGPSVSPVESLARRTLSLPGVILLYLLAVTGLSLLLLESQWIDETAPRDLPFDWLRTFVSQDWYRTAAIGIIGGVNIVALLFAGWVAWKRPLSRHHAGFVTIIAVLVLVFGTLYFFPDLHGA